MEIWGLEDGGLSTEGREDKYGGGHPKSTIHFGLLMASCDCSITTSVIFYKEKVGEFRLNTYILSTVMICKSAMPYYSSADEILCFFYLL